MLNQDNMRRRLRHGRQKAPFGSQEAAILGAAAMNVAAIAAQAKMQKDATLSQAKTQAQSIKEQAKVQSEAISEQNENNTKLNEDMINANKELAAQQKAYQDTIQMNLQLQNGMQNEQTRMEESKMIVKNGGNLNKSKQSLLRGGNNLRFKLPRRGNVELVGVTPEGYNLYSIYGPSHKSGGVDIDFENGGKIEAEGDAAKTGRNKKGFRLGGEYMLTTPNDAFFISQHDIDGFNPAEAVDNGMHPLQAFNIQEINKKKLGIKDDGSKKAMNGNSLIASGLISPGNPSFPNINDAVIFMNNNKRQLRNGGRVKAAAGTYMNGYNVPWYNYKTNSTPKNRTYENMYGVPWNQYISTPSISTRDIQQITPSTPNSLADAGITGKVDLSDVDLSVKPNTSGTRSGGGFNWNAGADLIGSGLVSGANILAAASGIRAQRKAANIIADARREGESRMIEALNNMRGISPDFIKSIYTDNKISGYAPLLRRYNYNANPQLVKEERDENARVTGLSRNSLSAAAMNRRIGKALTESHDRRMGIYADKYNRETANINKNIDTINRAAEDNARMINDDLARRTSLALRAEEFNAGVNNDKWKAIANIKGQTSADIGDVYGSASVNNAKLLGDALIASGSSFASSLSNMAKRKADLDKVLLGADPDNVNAYYAYSSNISNKQAAARLESLRNEYNSIKDDNPERARILARRIREIENARGFNS